MRLSDGARTTSSGNLPSQTVLWMLLRDACVSMVSRAGGRLSVHYEMSAVFVAHNEELITSLNT